MTNYSIDPIKHKEKNISNWYLNLINFANKINFELDYSMNLNSIIVLIDELTIGNIKGQPKPKHTL